MDDFTHDYEREQNERAFGKGVEEGKNGHFCDDLFHDLGEAATVPETTEHQSREPGYKEGRRRRTGRCAMPRSRQMEEVQKLKFFEEAQAELPFSNPRYTPRDSTTAPRAK